MKIENLNNIDVNCEYLIIERLELSIEDNINNINLPLGLRKFIINNLVFVDLFDLELDEMKEILISFIQKIKIPFGCKLYFKSKFKYGLFNALFIYNLNNNNMIKYYYCGNLSFDLIEACSQFKEFVKNNKNKLKSIFLE